MAVGGKGETWRTKTLLGLAGEYRVMAELLLRGYNPARMVAQNGFDLMVGNGLRIEVKAARRGLYKKGRGEDRQATYHFSLVDGRQGRGDWRGKFDILICWGVDDDIFYIIPAADLPPRVRTAITLYCVHGVSKYAPHGSQYSQFRDRWDLFKEV